MIYALRSAVVSEVKNVTSVLNNENCCYVDSPCRTHISSEPKREVVRWNTSYGRCNSFVICNTKFLSIEVKYVFVSHTGPFCSARLRVTK